MQKGHLKIWTYLGPLDASPGDTSEFRSTRPHSLLVLTSRCLYQGVHLSSGQPDLNTSLSHQMPLLGGTSELRSTGPNLVLVLATRCLYLGGMCELGPTKPNLVPVLDVPLPGVHLIKSQSDPKVNKVSSWPNAVPLLATRCLYSGGTSELKSTGPNLALVLTTRCLYQGSTSDQRSAWPKGWQNVKLTSCSTLLGHQMHLLGHISELRSTGPSSIPQLTTIAVVLTNTSMWEVKNSTILEG